MSEHRLVKFLGRRIVVWRVVRDPYRATSVMSRLRAALNEPHDEFRLRLLQRICADDVEVRCEGARLAVGIVEVSELIRRRLAADDKYHVEPVGVGRVSLYALMPPAGIESTASDVRVQWRVFGTNGVEDRGIAAVLAPNGQLSAIDIRAVSTTKGLTGKNRVIDALTSNPLTVVGALGGSLYLLLRIPSGRFYGKLGTTPDEVGLGPEVLVPQSLLWLVLFLLVMVAVSVLWLGVTPAADAFTAIERLCRSGDRRRAVGAWVAAFGVASLVAFGGVYLVVATTPASATTVSLMLNFLATLVPAVWAGALAAMLVAPSLIGERGAVREMGRRQRVFVQRFRRTAASFAIIGAMILAVFVPIQADNDADAVKAGVVRDNAKAAARDGIASGEYLPWRAHPAYVTWAPSARPQPLRARSGITDGPVRPLRGARRHPRCSQ